MCTDGTLKPTSHLEEGIERMLVLSIDVDLQRQFKVGLEAITRPDMFQTVEDFGSVVAGFLL